MSTPDKQEYVRSAIHKSGGINKSLLTPYKRIGLSRNIKKLFKSPLITNESEVLASLTRSGSSSSTPTTPIVSKRSKRADRTPIKLETPRELENPIKLETPIKSEISIKLDTKLDTPILNKSLQNKLLKKAKVKPRVSFTKKLEMIESDGCNNVVKSSDFSDSDSEPLIALKKNNVIEKVLIMQKAASNEKVDTTSDKTVPTDSPKNMPLTSNKVGKENEQSKLSKRNKKEIRKRLSLKRSNSNIAGSDTDDDFVLIKPKKNRNFTISSDHSNNSLTHDCSVKLKRLSSSTLLDSLNMDDSTPSNSQPDQNLPASHTLQSTASHQNLLLSKNSSSRLNLQSSYSNQNLQNSSLRRKLSLSKNVSSKQNPSSSETVQNSPSSQNLQDLSSIIIVIESSSSSQNSSSSSINMDSQKDVKLQNVSSSTILEGLNIDSTPTNDQSSSEDMATLIRSVQDLDDSIRAKEKKLADLKQAALYKKKYDVGKLRSEVDVWRNGCKEALQQLYGRLKENGPVTMDGLIRRLNIPPDMFRYDEESDCLL